MVNIEGVCNPLSKQHTREIYSAYTSLQEIKPDNYEKQHIF